MMLYTQFTSPDQSDFLPDREIGFDYPMRFLEKVPGEFVISRFVSVEDRKGNPGIFGDLLVTNLRIIWLQSNFHRVNLSIGYNNIVKMALVQADLKQDAEHVHIKAMIKENRFEFFFYRKKNTAGTFDIFPRVYNSYDSSRGFREILIRKIISQNDQLVLYDKEQIIKQYPTVWNLGKNEGKLGRFFFTNVRVVWISSSNENFNISIPYIRILRINKKNSSYGEALGILTSKYFGGLDVGFKIDAVDFNQIINEVNDLWKTYSSKPLLGIPENIGSDSGAAPVRETQTLFKESELLDTGYNENQNIKSIYRDGGGSDVNSELLEQRNGVQPYTRCLF